MTTWNVPQLLAGVFDVPVPTVLIAPWQLNALFVKSSETRVLSLFG